MRKLPLVFIALSAITFLLIGTVSTTVHGEPIATPTPIGSATATPIPSLTASPTATPSLTPTPTATLAPLTMIRGNVNKVIPGPKLVGLPNQKVTVMCEVNVKNATTNSYGLYTVTFTTVECPFISPVTTKSSYNGSVILRQVWTSGQGNATIDLNF